ncbi:hypothetical protein HMPREF1207_05635 [Paenibacillus sp. HGH0039]|nr:hypothetical protein HMPREF1207_05635 [Paenibacillus sp. HGH0039]
MGFEIIKNFMVLVVLVMFVWLAWELVRPVY